MEEIARPETGKAARTIARLKAARSAGGWLAWSGLGLALLWWAGGLVALLALIGWDAVTSAQPALVVAASIGITLPGLLLIMAGFLAREHARAGAANAIVLEAATTLLTPAETLGSEAQVFAQQMVQASTKVDNAMGHALSAMRAMASEIGDERQRLESVTYASADNARDLATRLGEERTALEQLTTELRQQSEIIGEAIPRQASMIVDSAKAAASEVESAETALETRLNTLENTGRTLAQKIAAMDTLAAEAGKRNETLLFAIARMEEKLEQSRKTVETASRAGELAAAAAGTTGDRLMDAVRAALDGAKQASAEIQTQSLQASETAAKSLAELKDAGQQAAAAVRAAGVAARAEMDIAERRAGQASNVLFEQSQSIKAAASNPMTFASEPAHTDTETREVSNAQPPQTRDKPPVSPSRAVEEDLFEASADRMAQAMLRQAETERDSPPHVNGVSSETDMSKVDPDSVFDDDLDIAEGEADLAENHDELNGSDSALSTRHTRTNGHSFSDIIADMEREERPTLSREQTAQSLIDRFESSGIRLTDVFRPRDKKKIAIAARKGDQQRISAVRSQVGRQVDRVRKRLRGDAELMTLARDFVALEEADALSALENTHGSSKNASARLAAFLLVDAALA